MAAGRDVEAVRRRGSRSPLGYLESLLAPDGSVRYSRTGTQTPVWVTAQALTALARAPFPVAPVRGGSTSGSTGRGATATRAVPRGRPAPTRSARAIGARTMKKGATVAEAGHRQAAGAEVTVAEARLNGIARETGALIGLVLAPMLR